MIFCSFLDWLCYGYIDNKISDEKICAICLEPCMSYLKPCGHCYHYSCIKQWLNVNKIKKCPYCQKKYYAVGNVNGKIFLI